MKTLLKHNWQACEVSPDQTHHIIKQKAAYEKRFLNVLKFHHPGLAPVIDETGAYHINSLGEAIYSERYTRTFGFYCGAAAVNYQEEWFHIFPNGRPLYKERYAWCGNFQENFCVARDFAGFSFHIDLTGNPLYTDSYSYAGDFHDGVAVVQTDDGLHYHINAAGERIHPYGFIDLDVYHKGFARAKNSQGWFHIDRSGHPIYEENYALVEPFYNGIARVETKWGEIVLIDERGNVVRKVRTAVDDPFHVVSGDLVSYWRLFTLKTAQDLHVFDSLPGQLEGVAGKIGLSLPMAEKLLLGLKEVGYVNQSGEIWRATTTGEFLSSSHHSSLQNAQNLWMMEHFDSWQKLLYALRQEKSAFEKCYQYGWFDFLSKDSEKLKLYHRALSQYAKRDYADLERKIDFTSYQSVADIGGSTGAVLEMLIKKYSHLRGHLIDLPGVIQEVSLPESVRESIDVHPCNFFESWPSVNVDVAILCRVIHDWPDQEALHILKQAHTLLKGDSSRLLIIENILDKESGSGALLNLNMLVMTGGKERTLNEFIYLFKEAGFLVESKILLNTVSSIFVLKPLN